MSIRLTIKRITSYLVRFVAFVLDLLGFKYIWYKLNPHKKLGKNEPKTIMLWLLSINAALFSIASSRYEQELTRLEYRVSNLIMQIETDNGALSFISGIQNRRIPYKPSIYNPWSTIKSFLSDYDKSDLDLVSELQDVVIKKKHILNNIKLNSINLVSINLNCANFSWSDLTGATFREGYFMKADFRHTNLTRSEFYYSYLQEANFDLSLLYSVDFRKANLTEANFGGAILGNTDFREAQLIGANLSEVLWVDTLAQFREATYNSKDIRLAKIITLAESRRMCASNNQKEQMKCLNEFDTKVIPPTKFPIWFKPQAHGMIDASEFLQPAKLRDTSGTLSHNLP